VRRVGSALLLAAIIGTGLGPTGEQARRANRVSCPRERLSPGYARAVDRALSAKRDVWGNALLRSAGGPTYEGVRRYLKPLLLAGHAAGNKGKLLTDSGVYYLAFGQPLGAQGAGSVALHVADGSQIVSERVDGPRLSVGVGKGGRERYGSCRSRMAPPRLSAGYLPMLETRYRDSAGVRYEQESFVARVPQTHSLVSFVRLTVDAQPATATGVQVRFTPSVAALALAQNRLVHGKDTYLFFGAGGHFDGSSVVYSTEGSTPRSLYVAWLDHPSPSAPFTLDQTSYERARRSSIDYWSRRLSQGTTFVVPDKRVLDAERNLLIQNLEMTWRYSLGNDYEEFEFPESIDGAEVMGAYGFQDVERAILRTSLRKKLALYPNWEMGEKLLGSALYYRLFGDGSYIAEATPALGGYTANLGRQIAASRRGILHKERYASDLPDSVYGLDSQAVVWQGLRAMAQVWRDTRHRALAQRARSLAARLGAGLRAGVRASARKLPDGSLFIPVKLLDDERPYGALTASRSGSYWNLVIPYALASGLFAPRGYEAVGALRYMMQHGSRFLGLVRAAVYSLYENPSYPASGSDEVYGLHVARFLADNDKPDQLVLSLYGALAAGMTPGTFVSGEGATIAPIPGEYFRKMYLPPNSVSNAAFLETLRLMLIHETTDRNGVPLGLELAYATPRAWLRPGARILVNDAPTGFGPLSFSIEPRDEAVHVVLSVPTRAPLRTLGLRLRLPRGDRMTAVTLDGQPFSRFNPATQTIDLSGRTGSLSLDVAYASRRNARSARGNPQPVRISAECVQDPMYGSTGASAFARLISRTSRADWCA